MRKASLFLTFALIGTLVVSSISIPLQAAIPASERAALVALYNTTKGDNWIDKSGWKTPPLDTDGFAMPGTEDTWFGITVSGDHVTEIIMDLNNLQGNIPAELGNLSNLKSLWFNFNYLTGNIPPELGNLSNLEELFLIVNKLSGNIPAELGKLGNLRGLDLFFNRLSGSIPPELGNLGNLMNLSLSSNQLSGSIPPELEKLANVWIISLDSNQLSGNIPPELGNLSNLDYLILNSNRLSGSIPPELGDISGLNYLSLSSNQLSGSIPPELGNLTDVFELELNSNQLSGSIPTNLMNLTLLLTFSIRGNCLSTNDADLRTWLNRLDEEWESHQCTPPFGSFDTPVDGSSVASSIAVTGWALDESGVTSVKIYREQDSQLIYIGDALFVEGARPDVAGTYSDYPNNTKAGWGYMLLTNFLPNSGNGTFVLHAIASNAFGKTVTLGTKTITCDNANAVKPFGAIDTPTQGGTASGSSFVNWGWALTPQPNSIPADGSSIDVWVDGVKIGNPAYNVYRSDIASLFPGYANSNGAIGYFYLDTTAYANGVHTIQWTAKDSGGNSDGIGSRYFSIQNTGGARASSTASAANSKQETSGIGIDALKDLPIDYSTAVRIRKGFVKDIEPVEIYPDMEGLTNVEIKEMERIELDFSTSTSDFSQISGYMKVGDKLCPLPVGSTLAAGERKFYWQPGPGFIGEYRFVFIEKEQNTDISRKIIVVKIVPRFQ
jgi:Leucine-rich repeat (LRR) protein